MTWASASPSPNVVSFVYAPAKVVPDHAPETHPRIYAKANARSSMRGDGPPCTLAPPLSLSFSIRGGGNTDDDDDDHATIRGVTGTGKGKTGVGRRERKIGRQNSRSPTTICRRRKAR